MVLPLLPASDTLHQFARWQQQAVSEASHALFDYVEATWINSSVCPSSSMSAFRRPIRTNNDVEGWQYWSNRTARSTHLPFYVLICLLWDKVQTCKMQLKLVSDRKLTRSQSKRHKYVQSCLIILWTELESAATYMMLMVIVLYTVQSFWIMADSMDAVDDSLLDASLHFAGEDIKALWSRVVQQLWKKWTEEDKTKIMRNRKYHTDSVTYLEE